MGMLMVIGIAVSNGILLVDDASVNLNGGASKEDAVVGAARTRFTPIVMTSLATVLGLLPTALGLEAGTEANQPLALAVVGGLLRRRCSRCSWCRRSSRCSPNRFPPQRTSSRPPPHPERRTPDDRRRDPSGTDRGHHSDSGRAAYGADGGVHRDSPDVGAPGAFLGPLPTAGSRGNSEAAHDYPLVTRPNGTLFYDSPQFSAAVAADGTVTFHDHRTRYSPRDAMLSFDLSDEFVRELAHGTLYPHEKANFLAATFERRTTMAARAHSAQMRTALEDIPRRLDALWADTRYRRRERRRVIFLLWEEADTSTAAGRSADRIIEAWIREHLPLGSSDAYGKAELDAISRERAGHPPFRPYPSPLEMRSPSSRQSGTAP